MCAAARRKGGTMRKALFATGITIGVALLGSAERAHAWGGEGHRIVALIAQKLLPTGKADALDTLLRTSKVKRTFVDAASYADDVIRAEDHAGTYGPWHYVSWPIAKKKYSCGSACIIRAATSSDSNQKALAVSWILHLIGDLHQPLHVGDKYDGGGNGFDITYRGKSECQRSGAAYPIDDIQLHKVWDNCLVFDVMGHKSLTAIADELRGALTSYNGHAAANGDHRSWAIEAHGLAMTAVYKGIKKNDDLKDAYIDANLPVVRDQLLKAGIRLAKVLDENL